MTMQMIVAEVRRVGITSIDNDKVIDAWNLADAMQAEADKRAHKEPRETHKNLAEFKMYPEYDASINYPPDAWVMYKGEKRLAASIDIKKEWQPDWSQAPDGYNYWAFDGFSKRANWYKGKPYLDEDSEIEDEWNAELGKYHEAPSFGYTGDWRESLRKRPK